MNVRANAAPIACRERCALRRVVEVFTQDDELVAAQTGEGVAGPEDPGQAVGDGDQQLVTDVVAVRVVDRLELVEVGEQDRNDLVGPLAAHDRVVETLYEQRAVRQSGQRVVERALVRAFGRLTQVGARLGVEKVRGGDIGKSLRGHHRPRVQRTGNVAVHVERAELVVALAQREGEDGHEACVDRARRELREAAVDAQVGNRDRVPRVVGRQARAFAELRLQLFEPQRRGI